MKLILSLNLHSEIIKHVTRTITNIILGQQMMLHVFLSLLKDMFLVISMKETGTVDYCTG